MSRDFTKVRLGAAAGAMAPIEAKGLIPTAEGSRVANGERRKSKEADEKEKRHPPKWGCR